MSVAVLLANNYVALSGPLSGFFICQIWKGFYVQKYICSRALFRHIKRVLKMIPSVCQKFFQKRAIFVLQDRKVSESMAMILLNSSDLLRVDLKGVNVILPDLVTALEAVLGDQVTDHSVSSLLYLLWFFRNIQLLLTVIVYLIIVFTCS